MADIDGFGFRGGISRRNRVAAAGNKLEIVDQLLGAASGKPHEHGHASHSKDERRDLHGSPLCKNDTGSKTRDRWTKIVLPKNLSSSHHDAPAVRVLQIDVANVPNEGLSTQTKYRRSTISIG